MNLSRPCEFKSASAISGSGGLNIGNGINMGPNTYWPGLIDNVRIYSRTVTP